MKLLIPHKFCFVTEIKVINCYTQEQSNAGDVPVPYTTQVIG